MAFSGLGGTTLNLRLLLQAPAPAAFLARTFQLRATFAGRAFLLFHERLMRPLFLSSSEPLS